MSVSIIICVLYSNFYLSLSTTDCDNDFFYYLLLSSNVQNQFKSLAAGSVVKNISGGLVKKTILLIPPKKIQIDISKKLSIASEYIEKLNKLILLNIKNYQQLKLSIFNNLIHLNTKEI